jgi:SAM-dependent methyltransferase
MARTAISFDSLPGTDRGYLAYHAPRFRFLLELCEATLPAGARRVLDIGPSPFSVLLRRQLACPVDTLGLEAEERSADGAVHHHGDLNRPEELPEDLPEYDLIVFAEVVEHLHTAPTLVLNALRRRLAPGGVMILQTPNAASLPKRLKLLAGRNPYDLIRENAANPGHFREYTLRELRSLAERSGFQVESASRRYYFDARYAHHQDGTVRPQPLLGTLKNLTYRALPPFLREGMTLVLRKPA